MPKITILGIGIDEAGRCIHWHDSFDVIANKCHECDTYFACYLCHDDLKDHIFQPMPMTHVSVMCGICQLEMTGNTYSKTIKCPNCGHDFNPNCNLHHNIYFS